MTFQTPSLIERLEPVTTGDAGRTVTVTVPYADLTPTQKLQNFWNAFCDCDWHEEGFPEEMEAAGFVTFRTATQDDVDACAFPEELGIVKGQPIWSLTNSGRAALSSAKGSAQP